MLLPDFQLAASSASDKDQVVLTAEILVLRASLLHKIKVEAFEPQMAVISRNIRAAMLPIIAKEPQLLENQRK